MGKGKKRFETRVIHEGYDSADHYGALTPPIYQTSTFTFANAKQGEHRFAGEDAGYIYSRLGNPTVRVLEDRIASLENGKGALAFGSGMAAVSAVLFHLLKSGDHILCSRGVYGCTFGLLEMLEEKFQIKHDYIKMATAESIEGAIRENTACIYIETPINPTMELIDLALVCKIANQNNIPVVVDNTFCSPYLQQPLNFGANFVLHSATKYICGHGDVVGGLLVGDSAEEINHIRMTTQKDIGGIMSPFDAWLLIRGLKTLPIRMDRHCENAEKIAEYLKNHHMVKAVHFPGIEEHAGHLIAVRQMKKFGGLISFVLEGSKETAQAFMNELKMVKIAVSLGDAETLIQHPATMTHSIVPKEARGKMGITDSLLRLSVGLEAWEDVCEDLEQSFQKLSVMAISTDI
ncbi:methionine gamma-lyase [Jeotgalibacillus proteolyticus]|uniref:L-methionine gamma-lyase n=1 Tax=Jeotgalibacillus proteolyticus TaxID=2082395 RepID=A0A2S5GFG1_9BACL|nr:methionine gamma-lyase [Jeotgalibacillus proteolyticus]PPA71655.1 methionine gamma-lyase [Jeotgalibacillus proteolyticus]